MLIRRGTEPAEEQRAVREPPVRDRHIPSGTGKDNQHQTN